MIIRKKCQVLTLYINPCKVCKLFLTTVCEIFDNIFMNKFGWLPDFPSIYDFTVETDEVSDKLQSLRQKVSVKGMLERVGVMGGGGGGLPAKVDLRQWCSPIEDQENIGSCTAHAGVGWV